MSSGDDKLEHLRRYQKDILEYAKTGNTICVLETGMGKTMIAIGLVAYMKQSARNAGVEPKITFFLAPTCNLTLQQANAAQKELKAIRIVAFVSTFSLTPFFLEVFFFTCCCFHVHALFLAFFFFFETTGALVR